MYVILDYIVLKTSFSRGQLTIIPCEETTIPELVIFAT